MRLLILENVVYKKNQIGARGQVTYWEGTIKTITPL